MHFYAGSLRVKANHERLQIYSLHASDDFCCLLIVFVNSLDSDQAR